jgi:hypothetical protein
MSFGQLAQVTTRTKVTTFTCEHNSTDRWVGGCVTQRIDHSGVVLKAQGIARSHIVIGQNQHSTFATGH